MRKKHKYVEDRIYESLSELELIAKLGAEKRIIIYEKKMPSIWEVLHFFGLVEFRPVTHSLKEKWEYIHSPSGTSSLMEVCKNGYREKGDNVEIVLSKEGHELYQSLCEFYRKKTGRSA